MSPKKAIEFYKKYLNIDVHLDSKEMIDSYDSLAVPYIDLKALDEQDILDIDNVNNNTISTVPQETQPIVSTESESYLQKTEDKDEIPEFVNKPTEQEYVEYDIANVVN